MNIELIRLRRGSGNGNPKDGLCLMQAVHWFSGVEQLSDQPECASPVLCAVGIRLNDMAPTQAARDSLWPLVWLLLDSRDPTAEQARAEYVVREVVHRIVATVFDHNTASALRAANSMQEIQIEAAKAAKAAKAVGAAGAEKAAGAAWATAAAAWAAEAGAAWATAAAAEAATAAEAVTAAEAGAKAWNELRLIFTEAILLGKHGDAGPVYEPRANELLRILELA